MGGRWRKILGLGNRNSQVEEGGADKSEEMRVRIEKSLSLLRGQLERLDTKYKELADKSKIYFERCIEAIVAKDEERAKIYASEIAELRKLANTIMHSRLVLLQVGIRLESILELGEILVLIKPLAKLLENVSEEVSGIIPEASENLRSLASLIEDFMATSDEIKDTQVTHEITEIPDEAASILEEARRIAVDKIKEQFPDIPVLTDEERLVYTYVTSRQEDEIDLEEIADTIGINAERLEEILQVLHEKGLIELEVSKT